LLQKGLEFPAKWSVTDSAGRENSVGISPRESGAFGSAAGSAALALK